MTDLNLKAGSEDFQCLYSSPVTCDAVKWSEDNLLAISTESGVSLLSPCDLAGSRQYATPAEQLQEQACGGHGPPDDLHARLVELRGPKKQRYCLLPGACTRSIDWSPQGCSESNTCLLAAIDEGVMSRVCIYSPPSGFKGQWTMAADLSARLLEYCEASGWREAVVSKPDHASPEDGRATRLRGGAPMGRRQAARSARSEGGGKGDLPTAEGSGPTGTSGGGANTDFIQKRKHVDSRQARPSKRARAAGHAQDPQPSHGAPGQTLSEGTGQDDSAVLTPVEEEDTRPLEELPEGFDASQMLPGADASSKESIIDTFPLVFVLRWLTLRDKLPEEEWETYGKGQHLRGADAVFADQVLDELVLCVAQYQSFAEQVSAAGLTKKDLLREGKRMIRQLAIQTGTSIKFPQAIIQQYGLRAVYERLIELLARQFPSSRAIAPLPPSEGISEAVPKRRRYSMPQDEYQATLSAEVFQQRLFVTSALQVAWSPAWKEGSSRYALVAVSTKAGRVWLWRYHLPLEYSAAADSRDLAARFALVGSFVAQASWVTALSWASFGDALLLATGCAEGSVRLHTASAATVAALPDVMSGALAAPPERVMHLVRVIAAPDLRQMTCVELRTETCSSSGEGRLHLAFSKAAGAITAWTSPRVSSLSALEGKADCGALCSVQQGSSTAVGLAWAMPPTRAQAIAAVLTAAAQDGSVCSWRWDGQQLRPCGPPQAPPGSQASHYTTARGKPCRAFGLAASGNSLYVAIARETPYAKQLDLTGGHMFKKVWQGSVQILQLAGSERPLGGQVLASLDLLRIATHGLPFPASRVWDIAAAVAVQERQDGEEDMTSALSTFEDKLEGLEHLCDAEEPASRQSDAAKGAHHALQLCNALRRLILQRLPCPDEDPALQMEQRIAMTESALLEQHVRRCLEDRACPAAMASWAHEHSRLPVSMVGGARGSDLQLVKDALAEATSLDQEFAGVVVRASRCPVTFQQCKSKSCWHCVLCDRSFATGPEAEGPPSCLFCGIALTRRLPHAFLQLPALC